MGSEMCIRDSFKIIESGSGATGVTSVFFTGITSSDGNPFISNNNINTNELPRGGVPISLGSTITGLGYAPLVGAKVKALTGTGGTITSIVGVAYTGSALGIVTATYNNVTGIITFQTGYGPSGLPHIGTFGEVARTTMMTVSYTHLTLPTIYSV